MTKREVVDWFRRELERRDTGGDETGAYTLAITALLRSIKSTRMAKKNAIARDRDKSRLELKANKKEMR